MMSHRLTVWQKNISSFRQLQFVIYDLQNYYMIFAMRISRARVYPPVFKFLLLVEQKSITNKSYDPEMSVRNKKAKQNHDSNHLSSESFSINYVYLLYFFPKRFNYSSRRISLKNTICLSCPKHSNTRTALNINMNVKTKSSRLKRCILIMALMVSSCKMCWGNRFQTTVYGLPTNE